MATTRTSEPGAGSRVSTRTAGAQPYQRHAARRPRRDRFERRREVLDAAAKVFYEKGYDASSTQDIADEIGMLKGSLYYYVSSKEDFLFEIISETHEGAINAIAPVEELEADTLEKLAALVVRQVEYFASAPVYATIFFREFRALSPDRKAIIDSKGDIYREIVRRLLETGRQDGTVNADVEPRWLSTAIVEMLNSVYRWFHPGGRISASQLAHDLATTLVVGVASQDAVEARGGLDAFRRHIHAISPDG